MEEMGKRDENEVEVDNASQPTIVNEPGPDVATAETATPQPTATATPSPESEPNPTKETIVLSSPTLIEVTELAEPTAIGPTTERSSSTSVSVSTKLNIYLREGPGIDYDIVSVISSGTTFQVQARSQFGNWYFGEVVSTGQVGWIWAEYAETTAPEPIEAVPTAVDIPAP